MCFTRFIESAAENIGRGVYWGVLIGWSQLAIDDDSLPPLSAMPFPAWR